MVYHGGLILLQGGLHFLGGGYVRDILEGVSMVYHRGVVVWCITRGRVFISLERALFLGGGVKLKF